MWAHQMEGEVAHVEALLSKRLGKGGAKRAAAQYHPAKDTAWGPMAGCHTTEGGSNYFKWLTRAMTFESKYNN